MLEKIVEIRRNGIPSFSVLYSLINHDGEHISPDELKRKIDSCFGIRGFFSGRSSKIIVPGREYCMKAKGNELYLTEKVRQNSGVVYFNYTLNTEFVRHVREGNSRYF